MTTDIQKAQESTLQPAQFTDPIIQIIERVVLDPSVDIDKLERILSMKERMDKQASKVAFSHALSVARSQIPPILKNATVNFSTQKGQTHYKHETLSGIAKTIDPILSQNGLSYRFRTSQDNGYVNVTCIISHKDGYSEETSLSGSPDQSGSKNSFQAVGSAVTYLQRYTLKAALGLSAEVDDDGQAAVRRNAPPKFDAKAVSNKIAKRIERASTSDDLLRIWESELGVIKKIKIEDPDEFTRLEASKDAAKAKLSQSGSSVSEKASDHMTTPEEQPDTSILKGVDYE